MEKAEFILTFKAISHQGLTFNLMILVIFFILLSVPWKPQTHLMFPYVNDFYKKNKIKESLRYAQDFGPYSSF